MSRVFSSAITSTIFILYIPHFTRNFLDLDIDKYRWPSKIVTTSNCTENFKLLSKWVLRIDCHCFTVKYFSPSETSKESVKFNNSIQAYFLRTKSKIQICLGDQI